MNMTKKNSTEGNEFKQENNKVNSNQQNNINLIFNDGLKQNQLLKLPFVRVAVDLTLNPSQIKQIFSKTATDK
jgi:hypothetical protein